MDHWLAVVGMWVMGQSLKMSSGCDGPEILLSEGGRVLRAELWETPELRGRWRKGRSGRSGQRGRSQDLGAELGEHFRRWAITMPDASEGFVVSYESWKILIGLG